MSLPPVQSMKPDQPYRWGSPRRVLAGFSVFGLVAMLSAAFAALAVSGHFNSRFALIGVALPLLSASLFLLVGLLAITSDARANRLWHALFAKRSLLLLTGAAFVTAGFLALIPSPHIERYAAYHEILLPFLVALALTAGAALGIIFVQQYGFRIPSLTLAFRQNRRLWLSALIALTVMLGMWLFIASTGRGVQSNEDYWFGAGTPLLFQQLLLSLFIAFLFSSFEKRILAWIERVTRSKISPDLILFFLIWVAAAILWAIPPAPSGFMALRPLPPNEELYPFADAFRYDIGSQFALIGQGLNDGRFYYRVFYVAYLFVLHSLFGQQYDRLMLAQAVLFAVFPALVYLLGKTLKSRSFGILAATVTALVGFNSILASISVDVANPKQMLTDFPTAIGVAGFALLSIRWWKQPQRVSILFWAAGVLGVAALVRTSAFGLFPLLLLFIWFAIPRAWISKLFLSSLALIVFFAAALPWSIHHDRFVGDMYSLKFMSVLNRRYNGIPNPAIEPPSDSTPVVRASPLVAIPDHFIHNLITSVLTLPPSLVFHDLRSVIREQFPYWDPDWSGRLDAVSSFLILINLAILALGIGSALQTSGRAGAIPLLAFVAFCGINSIGRTSGGRYSAPMDWIVLFYYAWGVMLVAQATRARFAPAPQSAVEAEPNQIHEAVFPFRTLVARALPAFIVMFGLSALLVTWSSNVPPRYAEASKEMLFEEFVKSGFAAQTGYEEEALREFLQNEQAGIWTGRALYPRYYLAGQGVNILWKAFAERPYPRLVFSLAGPAGDEFAILPGPLPKIFPNAVDVVVLGCKTEDAILAVVVLVKTPTPRVYAVPNSLKLQCPLGLNE